MSIQDIQNAKQLKKLKLNREQIAVRALVICRQAIEHGGYKNAIAAIGRMKALGQAISDSYWEEKRNIGYARELSTLLNNKDEIYPVE